MTKAYRHCEHSEAIPAPEIASSPPKVDPRNDIIAVHRKFGGWLTKNSFNVIIALLIN